MSVFGSPDVSVSHLFCVSSADEQLEYSVLLVICFEFALYFLLETHRSQVASHYHRASWRHLYLLPSSKARRLRVRDRPCPQRPRLRTLLTLQVVTARQQEHRPTSPPFLSRPSSTRTSHAPAPNTAHSDRSLHDHHATAVPGEGWSNDKTVTIPALS
jgi:hypothetical protein